MKFVLLFASILALNASSFSKIPPRDASRIGGRIIGGQNALPAQFPYAAAMYVQTSDSRHFCSGSLLSDQWILTAGQCVADAQLFQIFLGSIHLDEDDPERLSLATSTYVLHPNYNPSTLENDIGLVQLRIAITFTDYIKPIDILPLNEVPSLVTASIFGWGQINDNAGLTDKLQWVPVVTISNAQCKMIYGNQINDNMVCVEGNYNEGTCYGDIGSALIQHYRQGPTVYSVPVGVSSFVSFNGCESTDPSGFTRVYPYNAWIREVTGLSL